MIALILLAITTSRADPAWDQWRAERDRPLRDPATSYLAVREIRFLADGQHLVLSTRGKCAWGPATSGDEKAGHTKAGEARFGFSAPKRSPVERPGEPPFDLIAGGPWKSPCGWTLEGALVSGGSKLRILARDPDAPAFKAFRGSSYFPFDRKWILTAKLRKEESPRRLLVETTHGAPAPLTWVGTLELEVGSRAVRLRAFESEPGRLLVPFLDSSNGSETYAGGRYLEAELGAGGEVRLDFNRAYNPLCARNPAYNCIKVIGTPIPVPVRAGERAPATARRGTP